MRYMRPVFLLAFIWIFTLSLAYALSMNGAVFLAQVSPGEHIMHEMSVSLGKNESPMNFSVDISDIQQGLHGETLVKNVSSKNPYSTESFLKVSPSLFHIEPGNTQKILVEGDVPSNAPPGGKYALINIKGIIIQPNASKNTGVVTFGMAICCIVELTVSGNRTTKSGEIRELKAQSQPSGKQQNVSLIFSNIGNIHYKVKVNGELLDRSKKMMADTNVTSSIPIMPGASRIFNFTLVPKNELMPGSYDINATVRLEDGTFLASKEAQIEVKA